MKYRFFPNVLLNNLSGIEIGALHLPYKIDKSTKIDYLDVRPYDELKKIFIDVEDIVHNEYVLDISCDEIPANLRKKYDFVIANHVLEHVPNPIFALKSLFELINDNGYAFIGIPDKNFSYDKNRSITPFEHVLADYFLGNFEQSTDHIVDFLIAVHPEVFEGRSKEKFLNAYKFISDRKDHLHVWDSRSFRELLLEVISMMKLNCTIVYEVTGEITAFEYFCVIKFGEVNRQEIALQVLSRIYDDREDLKKAFGKIDFIRKKNLEMYADWIKNCECDGDTELQIAKQYRDCL